jgi:hypothetical protein
VPPLRADRAAHRGSSIAGPLQGWGPHTTRDRAGGRSGRVAGNGAGRAGEARGKGIAGAAPGERDVSSAASGRRPAAVWAEKARVLYHSRRAAGVEARQRGPQHRGGLRGAGRGGGAGCPRGSPLVKVSRVLLIERKPAAWMVDVVPEGVLGTEEIRERFRADAMLLDLLVSEGVAVGFSQMFIEAAMLGPDDPVGGKLRCVSRSLRPISPDSDHVPRRWASGAVVARQLFAGQPQPARRPGALRDTEAHLRGGAVGCPLRARIAATTGARDLTRRETAACRLVVRSLSSEGRPSLAEEHSLTPPPGPKAEPEPVMGTARTWESSSPRASCCAR